MKNKKGFPMDQKNQKIFAKETSPPDGAEPYDLLSSHHQDTKYKDENIKPSMAFELVT